MKIAQTGKMYIISVKFGVVKRETKHRNAEKPNADIIDLLFYG